MTKAEAINEFCEYLRTEGVSQINTVDFEQFLRQFIVNNGYSVRGFGRDTESNDLSGSISYTQQLIRERKVSNLVLNGSIYILNSGNSTYMGINTYGATKTAQPSFSSAPLKTPRQTQPRPSNTYNKRQAPRQSPRSTQNSYNNANNLLLVRIRGVLSVLILFAFIVNITRVVFTDFALSNPQFWALPIGLIATREALFSPNKDFNLLGRILITAIAWLSVSAFL